MIFEDAFLIADSAFLFALIVLGLMALLALVLSPDLRSASARISRALKARCHPQSGNVFLILFGAVILLGGVGNVLTKIISGPAQGVSTITRYAMSETDLANAARLLGAAARASVGDCDSDDFIEPLPWRDPAGTPAPTGGGLMPEGTPAPTMDQWKRPIGYCAWDHGSSTVSDDVAACGGNSALRLGGGDTIAEYVIVLVSSGPDGAFQTACRDFADANADGVPDQPLVHKAPGSDDIVLAYTYGELFAAGEGGTTGSVGPQPDEACTPETAGLLRDEMDTIQVCTIDGWVEVGASLTASGNFSPVTGAHLNSGHTSSPISFIGFHSTRLASVDGGANIEVNGTLIGPTAQITPGDAIRLVASAAGVPETERIFIFSISAIKREWRITTRDKYPAALSVTPASAPGMSVAGPGNPAYGAPVVFTVTNTGEADTQHMQAAVLSNTTNFEFYVGGGHLGDNCNGRTLAGGGTCQIAVRPRASNDGALSSNLSTSDGTASASATLSGTASGWNCTVAAGTTWTVAGKTCTAGAALTIDHGSTGIATDSTAPTTGSATYSCSGGVPTLQAGATCVEGCTVAAGTTWTVAGKTCTAPAALSIAHGGTGTATDATAPTTGSATYSCANGSTSVTASSCVESCAANQTVSWSNCSGPSGALLANGANRTINNTASGYTGTRTITCNNSSLSQSGGSCTQASGSQTYTAPGTYTFVVPPHSSLIVELWGAGAGGSGKTTDNSNGAGKTAGNPGGHSMWHGGHAAGRPQADGGIAASTSDRPGGVGRNGDINLTGGVGYGDNEGSPTQQTGGEGAGPGGGARTQGPNPANGNSIGGGGSGRTWSASGKTQRTAGGSGGGYTKKTYAAGTYAPGTSVTVVVGKGGLGGGARPGGTGADGQAKISWQ
ncbi:MAG TPA: hypothetical protein PLW75_02150 [Hyphomicrobium sp.]|nr:hypothetical protein [Hyphomicrobium sp.]